MGRTSRILLSLEFLVKGHPKIPRTHKGQIKAVSCVPKWRRLCVVAAAGQRWLSATLIFCAQGIWLFEIVRVFDGAQNGAVINYNTLSWVTPWTSGREFLHALSGSSAPWALRATSVWRNKRRYRSHTRVTWLMWVMVREDWWPGISLVIVKISSNSLFFLLIYRWFWK